MFIRSSRGAGLVLSLIVVAVLGLLSATVYQVARSLVRESVYQMRLAQAQAVAEAGLEDALYQLRENYAWRAGFTRKSFAGGCYTVRLSTDDAPWVTSTGYSSPIFLIGPAVRTVRAQARFIWPNAENLAVQANVIDVHAGALVDAYDSLLAYDPSSFHAGADAWSNGPARVESGARVWGKVSHGAGSSINAASVQGVARSSYTRTLTTILYPGANDNANLPAASKDIPSGAGYDSASRNLNVAEAGSSYELKPGTYHLHDVDISSGALITGTEDDSVSLYLDGNFNLGSLGQIANSSRIPARFSIYGQAAQSISLNSDTPLYADILAPSADITIGPRQVVYGRIVGNKVDLYGTFHFDKNLGRGEPLHVGWEPGSWSLSYQKQ